MMGRKSIKENTKMEIYKQGKTTGAIWGICYGFILGFIVGLLI
jgi:hypothetical protein